MRELKQVYKDHGNIKYAITVVSKMPNIPRADRATLSNLAAESSTQQTKLVKKAWEEAILITDRPGRIWDKLFALNSYRTKSKLVENLVDATKLPYSATMFVYGASKVTISRIEKVLVHVRIDGLDIDAHLHAIEVDFGKVARQVEMDLLLSQNESAVIETLERCFRTYVRAQSLEQASFYDLYMVGHASRVQAAENEGLGTGRQSGVNNGQSTTITQACAMVNVCHQYQTGLCQHGPKGEGCQWKHVCLWCGGRHGMKKCFSLIPPSMRRDNKRGKPQSGPPKN